MKHKQHRVLPVVFTLSALILGASATFAATGDRSDPLITMSYFKQTLIPEVLDEVEKQTEVYQAELNDLFSAQIDQYKEDVTLALEANANPDLSTEPNSGRSSFVLVTLTGGQTMYLDVGCEVLLRVGSATVQAATSPALIDTSTGGTIEHNTSLVQNHLYLSTIPDRTLTPTTDTVKLLVRGGYTIPEATSNQS